MDDCLLTCILHNKEHYLRSNNVTAKWLYLSTCVWVPPTRKLAHLHTTVLTGFTIHLPGYMGHMDGRPPKQPYDSLSSGEITSLPNSIMAHCSGPCASIGASLPGSVAGCKITRKS